METLKKLCLIALLSIVSYNTMAGCDMCSFYLGIHPNQNKNSISVRYRISEYNTTSAHQHSNMPHVHTTDNSKYVREFQTIEFWGQWSPFKKLLLIGYVPYSMNSVSKGNQVIDAYNNIGDAQILGRYQIFRTDNDSSRYLHRLILGLGIKAPTGVSNEMSNEGYLDPHIQTGTGSWDYTFNLGYLLKFGRWGLNEEFLYKLNTKNHANYKFANRISSNTSVYYALEYNELSILPSVSFNFEYADYDKDNSLDVTSSNGKAILLIPGIDMYYKSFSFNTTFQKPIYEDLNEVGASNTFRGTLGIGYTF